MVSLKTNISSLLTLQHLRSSQQSMQTAMQRLSSGLRINSAKDDPAGQAIANRMTAQIKGMTQAIRNTNDGISMVQTAEGSLNQVNDNLQRIRELSVQAANGTNSSDDLVSIQDEIDQRLEEIDRIAGQSNFNGIGLIDEPKSLNIQVGANDGSSIAVRFEGMGLQALGLEGFSILDDGSATEEPLATLDDAIKRVDRQRSYMGAVQNRFESVIDGLNTNIINTSAARSRIQDADYAKEVSNLVRAQILQQVGIAILAQANQQPQMILRLLEGL
ncbi:MULTISPECIES: flagellin [Halomonadaceae]|uniref:flagellin N-terminal helical domain-containing protein n=1 Tax=Halomonadaceae TaxID=28256 RepID=UPI000A281C34|nr:MULTISPECIES: flagellin [Halomonas]MCW4150693.1 flagellin [Halomonas sp. 18H]MDR5885922.1 flagellin [Halomonas janggokensis]QPL45965.1 flagellin FliC [Halomonas sp. A40-4]